MLTFLFVHFDKTELNKVLFSVFVIYYTAKCLM